MSSHVHASRGAMLLPAGRGEALLAWLTTLVALLMVLSLLVSFWLAGLTITEWRGAPAGSRLDIVFDEPAHPAWSW